jgi:hypothetical protein
MERRVNTSDMTALSALYADKVKYYGVSFDRAALVKKVADILAKKPYHQEIKSVSHWHVKNGERVQFHKSFGSRTENGGYLILDDKTHLVIEESDMTTDDTLLLAGKCIPYGQTVTVTGDVAHAVGTESEDFWVIGLDQRVCIMDVDGGARAACSLPEAFGGPSSESVPYALTGFFGPTSHHQECSFTVTSTPAHSTAEVSERYTPGVRGISLFVVVLSLTGCVTRIFNPGAASWKEPVKHETFEERLPDEMRIDAGRTPPPAIDTTPPPPRLFDATKALTALRAIDGSTCAPPGMHAFFRVHVRVTFESSGHVRDVLVDRPGPLSPATLECVIDRIKAAAVDAFDGNAVTTSMSLDVGS